MNEDELKHASNILDGTYGNEDIIDLIVTKPTTNLNSNHTHGYNPSSKQLVLKDGTTIDCSNKSYEEIYGIILKEQLDELESKSKTNYNILPTITSSASYYVAHELRNSPQCDWDRVPEYVGFSRATPPEPIKEEPIEEVIHNHTFKITPLPIKHKKESKLKKIFSPCNLKKIVLYFTKGFNIVKPFLFKDYK